MSDRFANLHKVPKQPASRLLAMSNAKLKTQTTSPANAAVEVLLGELEQAGAVVDMLRLISCALPPREAVWWACLAARDIVAAEGIKDKPLCLQSAEKWVFDPTPDNRVKVQTAIEAADQGDKTALAATAALYAPGNMGDSEDLKDAPAPPGIVANCAFGMNLKSLKVDKDPQARLEFLLDRAIDIARGGHGQIQPPVTQDTAEAEAEKGNV